MHGEKITQQPNVSDRPEGARDDDFAELNDWTITDIATTPNADPADRANAEAEIARRESMGIYDITSAPQNVSGDMQEHGFAVSQGKIAYPTREYREWLQSDRTTPPPTLLRETLAERNEKLSQENKAGQKLGRAALNESTPHYATELTEPDSDAVNDDSTELANDSDSFDLSDTIDTAFFYDELDRGRISFRKKERRFNEANEKRRTANKERKESERNKNNWINDIKDAKTLNAESMQEWNDADRIMSPKEHYEKAMDKVERLVRKNGAASEYYTEAALSQIEKGNFAANPKYFFEGLKTLDGKSIDAIAGDDETSDRVWDTIKYGDKDYFEAGKTLESLEDMQKTAIAAAVQIGAYREKNGITGQGDLKFTLPFEDSEKSFVTDVLRKYELTYQKGDGESLSDEQIAANYDNFESGFVGIINQAAIEDFQTNQELMPRLNWYYEKMVQQRSDSDIAERVLNTYEVSESDDFIEKFNKFQQLKQEIAGDTDESGEKADITADDYDLIADVLSNPGSKISIHDLVTIGSKSGGNAILDSQQNPRLVFPLLDPNFYKNPGNGSNKNTSKRRPGFGLHKFVAFQKAMQDISNMAGFTDKGAGISEAFYIDLKKHQTVPAKYDSVKGTYYTETMGKDGKLHRKDRYSDQIRQYVWTEFKLQGADFCICESITDNAERLYVAGGKDVRSYETVFDKTKAYSMFLGQIANGITVTRHNHIPGKKDLNAANSKRDTGADAGANANIVIKQNTFERLYELAHQDIDDAIDKYGVRIPPVQVANVVA